MGLPQISIEFKTQGVSAVKRGERGIVMLLLNDANAVGLHTIYAPDGIPEQLSAENKHQISLAMMGGVQPPLKVLAYVYDLLQGERAAVLANALKAIEMVQWDYLAIPDFQTGDETVVMPQVKSWRDNLNKKIKAVLPNVKGEHEGIINSTTATFTVKKGKPEERTYTTPQYCSRIAGLLAGTPLTISATYQVLPEVDAVPTKTKDELDAAIEAGEFICYHDGEKVKVARSVNSLTQFIDGKGEDFSKIKLVDIQDLIHTDIYKTVEDYYIGKYGNSYDNKCLLINAVQGYFESLELAGLLDPGKSSVGIDLDAQKVYLKSIGMDVTKLNDQQIKEANTKDKVFLKGNCKILDAIEDFNLEINI